MPKQSYKYLHIYNQIKEDIISGKYPIGSLIPTEDELVSIYHSSKTTIRHATKLLAAEKYVDIQRGRGTKVLPFAESYASTKYSRLDNVNVYFTSDGMGHSTNIRGAAEIISCTPELSERLSIPVDEDICRIISLHLIDGRTYGYALSYYSLQILPGLADFKHLPSHNLYGFLMEHYGIGDLKVEDTMDTAKATLALAQQLGTRLDDPLLLIRRSAYCDKGIYEYCETYIRSDLFHLVITMNSDYFNEYGDFPL